MVCRFAPPTQPPEENGVYAQQRFGEKRNPRGDRHIYIGPHNLSKIWGLAARCLHSKGMMHANLTTNMRLCGSMCPSCT